MVEAESHGGHVEIGERRRGEGCWVGVLRDAEIPLVRVHFLDCEALFEEVSYLHTYWFLYYLD